MTSDPRYPQNEFAGYKANSIAFHADDGKVYINGQSLGYGTKYGSYDVVGCGITRNGDVYFTLNGMILPLVNIEMQGKNYPIVSMRGKYTSVSIESGPDFAFNHEQLYLYAPNCINETLLDHTLLLNLLRD